MIIAVDFDGTCVTHDYPEIGKSIGAEKVLKNLVKNGHSIILYTMRSHKPYKDRDLLQEAIEWFNKNDIPLFGVNENPAQFDWTDSPKPFAHLYIDDSALGCPKMMDERSSRAFVNWPEIDRIFKKTGIINTYVPWGGTAIDEV